MSKKKKPHNPLEGSPASLSIDMLRDPADDQVTIIIVHKDKPEYLNICLQSIVVTSLNNNFEIIVVDNGSTLQDSIDFLNDLEEQGDCKIIRNKENLWWSKAANQGAAAADKNSRYLVFLHADVVVLNPAWLDLLINVSESEDSGLVGVSMHSYTMDNQKIDFIEEWCMLVTKECWRDCGPFAEELLMIGAPFLFTIAAQYADHKPQVIRNNIVHHYAVLGVNANEMERFAEQAMVVIPNLMRNLQSKIKKKQSSYQ